MKEEPRPELIQGTGDVMIQKITGVVYKSAPIVFLSVSPTGGTVLASVYAVYNNVFQMLKNLLHAVIDAPRHSLGQLLTEREREDVWPVFSQYEYIAFLAVFVMLSTCCALILPFIRLYTAGIEDANYYDITIAVLMVVTSAIEMMHIPSGHLLNMAVEDLRQKGISPVYLVTDHTGFYERYGWEFLCLVQGDGEPDMTRMYIHR